MSKYIGYEVRAFAERIEDGRAVWKQVPDEEAEVFAVYGHVGIFQWEWLGDVPTRDYGERKIAFYKTGRKP